jgi:hypothetical protein
MFKNSGSAVERGASEDDETVILLLGVSLMLSPLNRFKKICFPM